MPSTNTNTITAKASYKKLPGLLELTSTHLQWTQDGKKAPSVHVSHAEALSLFCSKEGAAQVRLKIGLLSDEAGHNFTFASPQAVALVEREKFKTELTNIIGRNRVSTTTATGTPNRPPGTPLIPGTPATPSHVQTPRPVTAISRAASSSRAPSVASDSRGPGTPIGDPTTDFRLRKKVLVSTPELAQLHRELVMTGQISENEFWEGREHLLLAQAAAESQKRGKPGQLVDPRPQTVDGEVKIVITPQLVHDIFEEYPVVAKAYNDNVPNKLSESEFWIRYFQSKLFNAHRASIRSSATQHVVKDDPIFDKYLEKDDDELEPRRQREEGVDMFIDLGATAVDHGDTGNEKDVTMQAGKQRAVLPLIRKFNEHSGRLLNSSLGEQPAKRRRVDSGNEARYSQLDLEDLHTNDSSEGILLDMQDRRKYFEGRSTNLQPVEKLNVKAVVQEANTNIMGWETRLSQLKIERKAGDAALVAMTQNVVARLEVTKRKSDLPEGIFRQMTTCQTAANEFLRQFWLAIYPPPLEVPTASSSNPAQRTAKAAKMAGYLEKTHEKVDGLVRTARHEGIDQARIQVAMKPILDAVDKALAFWRTRSASVNKPPLR